jgi:NDP-sugar pyrophosphorylase family protein
MTQINHAIIMAAGRGARMAPLTDDIPKPMAPYGASTLIASGIEKIRDRIPHIHVTVGYKKAMLAQHVIEHGASSVFNTEGHSNSWWIYNTLLRDLNEPIYVLTSDNVVDLDFDLIEENYHALDNPACMIVPVKPVEGLEGDYIFHDDHIVTELNRYKPSDIYCSGIQILNPAKINQLTVEGDDFYSVWHQLIEKRQLKSSSVYPKKWFTVDTVAQLAALNQMSAS